MSTELIERKEFNLDNFPPHKQLYLSYRIYGLGIGESMRKAGLKPSRLPQWRMEDKEFKSVEKYIENNGIELKVIAGGIIDRYIERGVLRQALRINELSDKVLNKEEIAQIKWAVDVWFKRREKVTNKEEGSYDELVLKRHRKV